MRDLIYKGAKREIKDDSGNTPYDLIDMDKFTHCKPYLNDLKGILGK